mgnify:CR=1 FL=1
MQIVQWNNKTYQFDQDLAYDTVGTVKQTLTSGDNQPCELTFVDGKLVDLVEL